MSLVVSLAVKKGIASILLLQDGSVVSKEVYKIKSEVADGLYSQLINTFKNALLFSRGYIESNNIEDVIFEVNNSAFKGWIDNQYSKEAYQKDFYNMWQVLQTIPITYRVIVSDKPKALLYCSESYIKKPKLSGLDSLAEFKDKEESGVGLC